MTRIGYHSSHEQFAPRDMLALVQQAERAGFQAIMSADHFAPWSVRQGESCFTWSWLGAAMQATTLPFGSLAIPMGWRYHPAILAQAAATLAGLFPGRLRWIAAGTGQALNEHITGEPWPSKQERNARLKTGVDIMRALWAGETVTRMEGPIHVHEAKLWSLPDEPPRILAAALTPETAEWAGGWADGLITINQPLEKLQALLEAFRRGGGAGKPVRLQAHLSWAASEEEAQANAHDQWRTNVFPASVSETLHAPEQFDAIAASVTPEDVAGHVCIASDPRQHIDWISRYAALGFDEIYLHNVGRNQTGFIETFGRHVLPAFQGGRAA